MKFLDLFAGVGGFRLGMESAGHECVGYVEIDKYARKSYQAIHHAKGEWTAHDITTVEKHDIESIGHVDVICGGFPCQAFSVAGHRRGFEDTRGTLFFDAARFASILRPKLLFLENVKGLLNHDKGQTFRTILYVLDSLGYDVEWALLNSKDFGVPQNRERVFIIGHLRGECARKVFPIGRENKNSLRYVGQLDMQGHDSTRRVYDADGLFPTLTTMMGGNREPKALINIDRNVLKIRKDDISTCIPASYFCGLDNRRARTEVLEVRPVITPDRVEKRQNGRRFKDDGEEMFTLTSQDRHGVLLSDAQEYRIRKLTPRECWRLQGYPDWAFDAAKNAGVSDTQLYKQAGNSVTVNVIAEIAKRLS